MRYQRLINLLLHLEFIEDSHESHPEETTLHHSVQSYVMARKESDDKELWIASLFHDIGKNIETCGHERLGVDILESFGYKNEKVLWLIKNHMRIRWFLNGRIKKHGKIQGLLTNQWLPELIHLRRLDGVARKVGTIPTFDKIEVNNLLEETNEY